jgi:hypothetical protein
LLRPELQHPSRRGPRPPGREQEHEVARTGESRGRDRRRKARNEGNPSVQEAPGAAVGAREVDILG